MLLGSPPDMVHGSPLRKTDASTPLIRTDKTARTRVWEFIPAIADCRSQGTAISPTSATLSQTGMAMIQALSSSLLFNVIGKLTNGGQLCHIVLVKIHAELFFHDPSSFRPCPSSRAAGSQTSYPSAANPLGISSCSARYVVIRSNMRSSLLSLTRCKVAPLSSLYHTDFFRKVKRNFFRGVPAVILRSLSAL